jgi:hypothetical protein
MPHAGPEQALPLYNQTTDGRGTARARSGDGSGPPHLRPVGLGFGFFFGTGVRIDLRLCETNRPGFWWCGELKRAQKVGTMGSGAPAFCLRVPVGYTNGTCVYLEEAPLEGLLGVSGFVCLERCFKRCFGWKHQPPKTLGFLPCGEHRSLVASRPTETKGGDAFYFHSSPTGFVGPKQAKTGPQTAQKCFEVFSSVFIEPEINTPKPAQALRKSLAPNGPECLAHC